MIDVTILKLKLHKLIALWSNCERSKVFIKTDIGNTPSEILWDLIETQQGELVSTYKQLVVSYVSKYVNTARANTITIYDRRDFRD